MTYSGNLGMQEMFAFQDTATPYEQKQMDKIVASEDWEAYTILITKVLNTKLK